MNKKKILFWTAALLLLVFVTSAFGVDDPETVVNRWKGFGKLFVDGIIFFVGLVALAVFILNVMKVFRSEPGPQGRSERSSATWKAIGAFLFVSGAIYYLAPVVSKGLVGNQEAERVEDYLSELRDGG